MDATLILAEQILRVVRESGVSVREAFAGLDAARAALSVSSDISFRNDLSLQGEPSEDF